MVWGFILSVTCYMSNSKCSKSDLHENKLIFLFCIGGKKNNSEIGNSLAILWTAKKWLMGLYF